MGREMLGGPALYGKRGRAAARVGACVVARRLRMRSGVERSGEERRGEHAERTGAGGSRLVWEWTLCVDLRWLTD